MASLNFKKDRVDDQNFLFNRAQELGANVDGAATTKGELPDPRRHRGDEYLVLKRDDTLVNEVYQSSGTDWDLKDKVGINGQGVEMPKVVDTLPKPPKAGTLAVKRFTGVSGRVAWSHTLDPSEVVKDTIIGDQRVYVGTQYEGGGGGNIRAYDRKTGKEEWVFSGRSVTSTMLLTSAGTLVASNRFGGANGEGITFGLDSATGNEVGVAQDEEQPYGQMVEGPNGAVYFIGNIATGRNGVVKMDPTTFNVEWRNSPLDARLYRGPVFASGRMYVSATDYTTPQVLEIDTGTGSQIGSYTGLTASPYKPGPQPYDNGSKLIVGDEEGKVYLLSLDLTETGPGTYQQGPGRVVVTGQWTPNESGTEAQYAAMREEDRTLRYVGAEDELGLPIWEKEIGPGDATALRTTADHIIYTRAGQLIGRRRADGGVAFEVNAPASGKQFAQNFDASRHLSVDGPESEIVVQRYDNGASQGVIEKRLIRASQGKLYVSNGDEWVPLTNELLEL